MNPLLDAREYVTVIPNSCTEARFEPAEQNSSADSVLIAWTTRTAVSTDESSPFLVSPAGMVETPRLQAKRRAW